ncbi:hypothetical protein QWI17_10755 [Gilvimarinus sp. SDUM040013]|uniref:Uncharacterized protein n=1 Tax=Gilvimarinus gilvus TaxID=3058038 RepID=A0ABU4RZD7_9GAMM|nr:hypothetical protein [Gilvimarinus sp. SDUM040013]MDO3386318.1 hypothetical protein [Gilvimarinus sp. SDUM040013]MDX6850024.1 hypothetical protein [Gilvimarinus sp. SDUM040013]
MHRIDAIETNVRSMGFDQWGQTGMTRIDGLVKHRRRIFLTWLTEAHVMGRRIGFQPLYVHDC